MLEATHFSSGYRFEFGARSHDFGYRPQSDADVSQWYGAAFSLIERLALTEGVLKFELRDLVARNVRGLWISNQELRVRHLHKTVDDYVYRDSIKWVK